MGQTHRLGKAKSLKRKVRIGAKLVVKRAPGAIPDAIAFLKFVAAQSRRGPLIKKAALNMARILEEAPDVGVKAMDRLLLIEAHKGLSFVAVCRIFGSPLAFTTLKGKMRALANHEIEFEGLLRTFEGLQKDVKLAYERKIPSGASRSVLECKKGEFYKKLFHFAAHYRPPKSYITDLVISRMEYLGLPEENIAEAEKIRWGMHQQSHKWHEAKKKGNKEAANRARKKIRELNKIFDEKFTKNL